MTRAEIIQEIHKRAMAESPWTPTYHLQDLIHETTQADPRDYGKFSKLLLDLAAQIVRVLAVMKPIKGWMIFDKAGNHWGMLCVTKKKAIGQKIWLKRYPDWPEARRDGWTARKVTITEGW